MRARHSYYLILVSDYFFMIKPITITVFFPVYNEEENIRQTILRTIRTLEDSPYVREYEIVAVNDGSSDNSREVAELLARIFPQVRVVNHEVNRGYGEALKTGIAQARMEYVFFTDADLQFDIVELQNLLIHLDRYPVVIGYRAPRRDPFMRLMNARVWNVLNRAFFGLKIRDIDCAFKIFRTDIVQSLELHSRGAMISAETLIRITRGNVQVKEVPVSHLPRIAGAPTGAKPGVILRALHDMVELYRGDLGLSSQKEAVRFMSVGVINTLLDAAAYVALTRGTIYFSEHLVIAKFASFLAGTVSSLILNRSWTFGLPGRPTVAEIARFYAMTSLSIVVNVALMTTLVGLGMYDLYALVFTTVFTFAINFTVSKLWVFRRQDSTTNTYAISS